MSRNTENNLRIRRDNPKFSVLKLKEGTIKRRKITNGNSSSESYSFRTTQSKIQIMT